MHLKSKYPYNGSERRKRLCLELPISNKYINVLLEIQTPTSLILFINVKIHMKMSRSLSDWSNFNMESWCIWIVILKGPYLLFNYCGYHGHNEELLHGHTRGVDHTESELTVTQITDEVMYISQVMKTCLRWYTCWNVSSQFLTLKPVQMWKIMDLVLQRNKRWQISRFHTLLSLLVLITKHQR